MKRFLIVDDEPAIARFVQHIARECGYEATVTCEPDAFMDEVARQEPDAIALDLAMPSADGIELLRFLATAKCRAGILVISGFDERVLETAGELGRTLGLRICGTLTKPIRAAELRTAIERIQQECVR
jgi:two-component system, OmpR family, response regulator